jgi:hypothetical protein
MSHIMSHVSGDKGIIKERITRQGDLIGGQREIGEGELAWHEISIMGRGVN